MSEENKRVLKICLAGSFQNEKKFTNVNPEERRFFRDVCRQAHETQKRGSRDNRLMDGIVEHARKTSSGEQLPSNYRAFLDAAKEMNIEIEVAPDPNEIPPPCMPKLT